MRHLSESDLDEVSRAVAALMAQLMKQGSVDRGVFVLTSTLQVLHMAGGPDLRATIETSTRQLLGELYATAPRDELIRQGKLFEETGDQSIRVLFDRRPR